jgi:hypothetical protein
LKKAQAKRTSSHAAVGYERQEWVTARMRQLGR